MTDELRLAELESAYDQILKKQDRLECVVHTDEVDGYALHHLLKRMKSLEAEIENLRESLDRGVVHQAHRVPSIPPGSLELGFDLGLKTN